ncbi:uncharacterized protein DUF3775 [Pseudomonas duriflava]|uniref:Uncharacterized protein DUF3775 n=1 Tax=Pseudomonas duriflava TaxID=459528 RepID=A0A562QPH1_9PSED|nr:DUF3775 domain-containing protein [Pseudomonas duriflava]TWI58658.1 uncharacterized protein DUF3775 [Pseudomonas duriflava]
MTLRLEHLEREQVEALMALATSTQLTHDGFGTGLGGGLGLGGESALGSLIGETQAEHRLREAISGLTREQKIELLALIYAGKDGGEAEAGFMASKQALAPLSESYMVDKCIDMSPFLHQHLERMLDIIA